MVSPVWFVVNMSTYCWRAIKMKKGGNNTLNLLLGCYVNKWILSSHFIHEKRRKYSRYGFISLPYLCINKQGKKAGKKKRSLFIRSLFIIDCNSLTLIQWVIEADYYKQTLLLKALFMDINVKANRCIAINASGWGGCISALKCC